MMDIIKRPSTDRVEGCWCGYSHMPDTVHIKEEGKYILLCTRCDNKPVNEHEFCPNCNLRTCANCHCYTRADLERIKKKCQHCGGTGFTV